MKYEILVDFEGEVGGLNLALQFEMALSVEINGCLLWSWMI